MSIVQNNIYCIRQLFKNCTNCYLTISIRGICPK